MRRWSIIIVLAVALLVPQYALTWNGRGHMMVAAVAYHKLNQGTKERVDALLQLNPDRDNWLDLIPVGTSPSKRKMMVFMIAATWADRIKSDPDYHTDGTHNGNRPPNDATAGQNIGFDDLARHKYWHFVDEPFSDDHTALPAVPTPQCANTDCRLPRCSSFNFKRSQSGQIEVLRPVVVTAFNWRCASTTPFDNPR